MNLARHPDFQRQRPSIDGEPGFPPCSPLGALACFGGGGGSSSQSTSSDQTNTTVSDSYNKTKSTYKTSKKSIKNSGNVDNSVKNVTKNVTMTGNSGDLSSLSGLGTSAIKGNPTSQAHKNGKGKRSGGGGGFKLNRKTLIIGAVVLVVGYFAWRKL